MSGILGIFPREGRPPPEDLARRLFSRLDHRGRFGSELLVTDAWILGSQRGEVPAGVEIPGQPRREGPLAVVLDGYLDNREELLDSLDLGDLTIEDPELLLAAYRRWGTELVERLVGPWALLLVDDARPLVLAARDPLGDRPLVYREGSRELIFASEEQALLAHPRAGTDPDEVSLAHFFAVRPPPPERTFFREIAAVPPGHLVLRRGSRGRLEVRRFWRPSGRVEEEPKTRGEWVEALRGRLRRAVRCRMREPGRTAVLMSGGLDSTSVAVEAARILGEGGRGGLHTISWIFEELPEADERIFMEPVVEAVDACPSWIVSDALWPLGGPGPWPVNPNLPAQSMFRRLLEAAYRRAREKGTPCLLSGDFGDHLFVGWLDWLRELLGRGHWIRAGLGMVGELSGPSGSRMRLGSSLGRVFRRPPTEPEPPPWLTVPARERLVAPRVPAAKRPEQLAAILGDWGSAHETRAAARGGVEIRRPYRDLRLVELFLAMPADLFYRPGWRKWALREAVRERLPERVRLRREESTLFSLAARGLLERERETADRFLEEGLEASGSWSAYVRPEWVDTHFPRDLERGRRGSAALVPWHCISHELWRRRVRG